VNLTEKFSWDDVVEMLRQRVDRRKAIAGIAVD
jgi:hypothetical protein